MATAGLCVLRPTVVTYPCVQVAAACPALARVPHRQQLVPHAGKRSEGVHLCWLLSSPGAMHMVMQHRTTRPVAVPPSPLAPQEYFVCHRTYTRKVRCCLAIAFALRQAYGLCGCQHLLPWQCLLTICSAPLLLGVSGVCSVAWGSGRTPS